MDTMEKSRIRLRHWIDHNADHLKGYREVVEALDSEGAGEAADRIRKAIELMELADEELEAALKLLTEPSGTHTHSQTEIHGHSHHHRHSHKDDGG